MIKEGINLAKGNKKIKHNNKVAKPNCRICPLKHKLYLNKNGKKNSVIFLTVYSVISLFILYDMTPETRGYLTTLFMFSIPILYELLNMKADNKITKFCLLIQKILFLCLSFISLIGILTQNTILIIDNKLVIFKSLPLIYISIGIDFLFWVILFGTISISVHVWGKSTPYDEELLEMQLHA